MGHRTMAYDREGLPPIQNSSFSRSRTYGPLHQEPPKGQGSPASRCKLPPAQAHQSPTNGPPTTKRKGSASEAAATRPGCRQRAAGPSACGHTFFESLYRQNAVQIASGGLYLEKIQKNKNRAPPAMPPSSLPPLLLICTRLRRKCRLAR